MLFSLQTFSKIRQLKTKCKNSQLIPGAAGTTNPQACLSKQLAADTQEKVSVIPFTPTPVLLSPSDTRLAAFFSSPFAAQCGVPADSIDSCGLTPKSRLTTEKVQLGY